MSIDDPVDIDVRLRESLLSHGQDAPAGVDLLERVQARSRHRVVRRRWTVTLAAVLVVVVTAGVPALVRQHRLGAVAAPSATASSAPAGPTIDVILGPPPVIGPPVFPYTPGWLPSGWGPGAPTLTQVGGTMTLHYGVRLEIVASATRQVPTSLPYSAQPSTSSVTIGTATGELTEAVEPSGEIAIAVSWSVGAGQWLLVSSVGVLDQAAVLRVARELRPVPLHLTGTPPSFRLATAPRGFTVWALSDDAICLVPPAPPGQSQDQWLYSWYDGPRGQFGLWPGVCVVVFGAQDRPLLRTTTIVGNRYVDSLGPLGFVGDPVAVSGRDGVLFGDGDRRLVLQVPLTDGRTIDVTAVDGTVRIGRPDLLAIAEGITLLG